MARMRIVIDTEFNDVGGDLISMALVADSGDEWYEVLSCESPSPWVAEHVMPILAKQPLHDLEDLSISLRDWLSQFDSVHIVADWPEDIAWFCRALITGPGQRIPTPPLTMEIRRDLPATEKCSAVPHNALEDARGLSRALAQIG